MANEHFSETEYKQAFNSLKGCLLELDAKYTLFQQEPGHTQNALFALSIVKCLLKYRDILAFVNPIIKEDLADSIGTHHFKYVDILSENNLTQEASDLVKNSLELLELMRQIKNYKDIDESVQAEIQIIKNVTTNIAQKCRALFSEQSHNQEAIDKLQAAAIAFNMKNLPIATQLHIYDKLLLIKELWQFEKNKNNNINDNFRRSLHIHLEDILKQFDTTEPELALKQFVHFLVESKEVLAEIPNSSLVRLYDRIKNIDPLGDMFEYLLHGLHHEAQFRYNYNRLSDSGYELLKRFQSYDAILHQIELSEFVIIESFLVKNSSFIQEILVTIAKHLDNIKVAGFIKMPELNDTLNRIKTAVSGLPSSNAAPLTTILDSIKSKFSTPLEQNILKRYNELDKFCLSAIKAKYVKLFKEILSLLDNNLEDNSFIEKVVVFKLAQDYHIPNLSNSISKLRQVAKDRTYIANSLKAIDFVALFDPANINKIDSLNFKVEIGKLEVKNTEEYINCVINLIARKSSASQLEELYRPMIGGNLSKVELLLKQAISKQIRQRTTLSKRLFSILTGKKDELIKLENIKKTFVSNPNDSEDLSAASLKDVKSTQNQVQDNLNSITDESDQLEK
jgi:hypothetical protein